jgi:hypothetical protein
MMIHPATTALASSTIRTVVRITYAGTFLRPFSSMQEQRQPRFSEGSAASSMTESLAPLLAASGGRWSLSASGEGLERTFKFKTFTKTWVRIEGR